MTINYLQINLLEVLLESWIGANELRIGIEFNSLRVANVEKIDVVANFQRLSLEQIKGRLDSRDITRVLDTLVNVGDRLVQENNQECQHQRQQAQAFKGRSR